MTHRYLKNCLTVGFWALFCISVQPGMRSNGVLLFDAPFPPTAYTKLLDESVQVLNYLETLQEVTLIGPSRVLVQDAVCGRLMMMQAATEDFLCDNSNGRLVLADDLDYLLGIMGRTQKLYRSAMLAEYVMGGNLLGAVKVRLEDLLR